MSTHYIEKSKKDEAIRLLKETSKSLREISQLTGVSVSSAFILSKEHRPKSVAQGNIRKGQLYSLLSQGKISQATFDKEVALLEKKENKVVLPTFEDFKEDGEKTKTVVAADTETATSDDPFKFNFNISLSEKNLTKEEVLSKLHNALNIIDRLPVATVSFDLTIREGDK